MREEETDMVTDANKETSSSQETRKLEQSSRRAVPFFGCETHGDVSSDTYTNDSPVGGLIERFLLENDKF